MYKLRVKNFGPIKEGLSDNDGWIEIKKVTVFIGNQGSGKSTVAKLFSTLCWIEKAINRGDFESNFSYHSFRKHFNYQNINSYFNENTTIEYIGKLYSIEYKPSENQKWPVVKVIKNSSFVVPKIMYVPDGRNFLSVIKNATGVKDLPLPLFDFAEELKRTQLESKGKYVTLPINNAKYHYDQENDTSFITGEDYEINMLAASSGFQSLVPMFLVTSNLSELLKNNTKISPANISVDQIIRMQNSITSIMLDDNLSNEEKLKSTEEIRAKFQNKALINIIEEPEQNLYPSSQQSILHSLLQFNNQITENTLLITTHSPYILMYLTLCIEADKLKKLTTDDNFNSKLNNIVPLSSTIDSNDLSIYEFNEKNGTIKKLKDYKGLPSDENMLNNNLGQTNDAFSELLEMEDLWQ
ncbi:MAG: AAA family ATPase [Bacteroidetes bacterium]|nr:AAA family ATPase [Bacteroidota bacterium]